MQLGRWIMRVLGRRDRSDSEMVQKTNALWEAIEERKSGQLAERIRQQYDREAGRR